MVLLPLSKASAPTSRAHQSVTSSSHTPASRQESRANSLPRRPPALSSLVALRLVVFTSSCAVSNVISLQIAADVCTIFTAGGFASGDLATALDGVQNGLANAVKRQCANGGTAVCAFIKAYPSVSGGIANALTAQSATSTFFAGCLVS